MHDLTRFSIDDIRTCCAEFQKIGNAAVCVEDAAKGIVDYLYDNLCAGDPPQKETVLVRFYQTVPFQALETGLQSFALQSAAPHKLASNTKCFTLLASRGVDAQWNSRHTSCGHKAIPLPSPDILKQLPMVYQLLKELEVEVDQFLKNDPAVLLDLETKTYNVFHVPVAEGSPYVPAQENFVVPYGVKSVVGFGGVLATGELIAVIMFTRVPISAAVADRFKTVALGAKMAILPLIEEGRIFSLHQV